MIKNFVISCLTVFITVLPLSLYHADDHVVHKESFSTDFGNKQYTYDIYEFDFKKEVIIKDQNGSQVHHLILNDDKILELENGAINTIATIETSSEKLESKDEITTYSTEPHWGGLTSQKKRVNINSKYRNNVEAITGIILSMTFPGASIPYDVATLVAENIFANKASYADLTCYYHVAAGCPQYRWYKKYVYTNNKGKTIKTYNMSRKSFIGVQNVPSNPPMCRLYGF